MVALQRLLPARGLTPLELLHLDSKRIIVQIHFEAFCFISVPALAEMILGGLEASANPYISLLNI